MNRQDLLNTPVEHIDITAFDPAPLIEAYGKMAFQARNLAAACRIYERMIADKDCAIILCLAGSLFSAGLKTVVRDLVRYKLGDAVVSTGAIIVDQDFFEALGFRHYRGTPFIDDELLRENMIDRIYDTFIDEEELRVCDHTVEKIADSLPPRPYSSREFIRELGRYLEREGKGEDSLILECHRRAVPVFVPAFSDCSAGFGLVAHQHRRGKKAAVTIDSARDFLELTRLKIKAGETGLVMIGGGVPKNFAQDIVVAADILEENPSMHRYAIQITVADERDGALSGSTLKEAHSWGKVDDVYEQMVYSEATIALPLLAGYVYHRADWRRREPRAYADILEEESR